MKDKCVSETTTELAGGHVLSLGACGNDDNHNVIDAYVFVQCSDNIFEIHCFS